jgi:hypothetical protein
MVHESDTPGLIEIGLIPVLDTLDFVIVAGKALRVFVEIRVALKCDEPPLLEKAGPVKITRAVDPTPQFGDRSLGGLYG